MAITPEQYRAALPLLGLAPEKLAKHAQVDVAVVHALATVETADGLPAGALVRVRETLEAFGIQFNEQGVAGRTLPMTPAAAAQIPWVREMLRRHAAEGGHPVPAVDELYDKYGTPGMNGNVRILDHPLVQHKLTLLRSRDTTVADFRRIAREISLLMCYEVTRSLPLESVPIETPLEPMMGRMISGKKLCLVSILRAGNGILEGMLDAVPSARVGHIGLYRDPATLQPVEYYLKLPEDVAERQVIVVDPMLATGHSAAAAIARVKAAGASQVSFVCLLSAPEGILVLTRAHPDVLVFTCAIDRCLDDHGYIRPGLGDAGDRLFGTK